MRPSFLYKKFDTNPRFDGHQVIILYLYHPSWGYAEKYVCPPEQKSTRIWMVYLAYPSVYAECPNVFKCN